MTSYYEKWYLSFDCATKSFAFALMRIRFPKYDMITKTQLLSKYFKEDPNNVEINKIIKEIDEETKEFVCLFAGSAVDLIPDKKNNNIPTVERTKAAMKFLKGTVEDAIKNAEKYGCPQYGSPELNVAIEFQMGPNASARTIAIVLLTHYTDSNTFLVGPAYKNKLWYTSRPDLRHCYFIEKYKTLYAANKNHSKHLYFDHISKIFEHDTKNIPVRLRKDFADCVMQVLGFLSYGDLENAAKKF